MNRKLICASAIFFLIALLYDIGQLKAALYTFGVLVVGILILTGAYAWVFVILALRRNHQLIENGGGEMPQTREEWNAQNNAINRALEGLSDTSASDNQQNSNKQGAVSPGERPSQLPVGEDDRAALADAVRKLTGGGK